MKRLVATRITWRDAYDVKPGEWHKCKGKFEYLVETHGFIVRETKNFLVITHTVTEDNNVCGAIAIPKACIIKRRDAKRKAQ